MYVTGFRTVSTARTGRDGVPQVPAAALLIPRPGSPAGRDHGEVFLVTWRTSDRRPYCDLGVKSTSVTEQELSGPV